MFGHSGWREKSEVTSWKVVIVSVECLMLVCVTSFILLKLEDNKLRK